MTESGVVVEVALALPERQWLVTLTVPQGTTAERAAQKSGLLAHLPAGQSEHSRLGIFGRLLVDPGGHILEDGERVEIYRSLLVDPKESRKRRQEQSRNRTAP